MAFIGINYTGAEYDYNENYERIETPGGLVYESVYLRYKDGERVFNSGDFIKDWYDAHKYYIENLAETEYLTSSSTCDHFFMDGAKCDPAYLHLDGTPKLKYIDYSDDMWVVNQQEVYESGLEFFVTEGTKPTWAELKAMCT